MDFCADSNALFPAVCHRRRNVWTIWGDRTETKLYDKSSKSFKCIPSAELLRKPCKTVLFQVFSIYTEMDTR